MKTPNDPSTDFSPLNIGYSIWLKLILLLTMPVCGQAAKISGALFDEDTSIYLEGAEVTLIGKNERTFTNRRGKFTFTGLEAGSYQVTFLYFGYRPVIQEVELVDSDSEVVIEISIQSDGEIIELDPFVVEGSIVGQAKAMNQKKAALNLTDLIASDAFGQFVDRNAAEALQRLPGISIEDSQGEGTFVIIRGAQPGWNPISIDGVAGATPGEGGRMTGLNIISVDQLERIEVQKSWLPRDSGSFVGGSVNLVTRSALDREGAFYGADFAVGQYAVSDEVSYRSSVNAGQVWGKENKVGVQVTVDWSRDNRGSDTLRTDGWNSAKPELKQAPFGFIVGGLQFEDYTIQRERFGLSGKVEWEPAENHQLYVSFSYNKFSDDEVLQETRMDADTTATNNYTGPFTLTEARAVTLGYDLNDPVVHERVYGSGLELRRLSFDEAVALGAVGYDAENQIYTASDWTGRSMKTLQNTTTEDAMFTVQMGGKSQLSDVLAVKYKIYQSTADKEWDEKLVQFRTKGLDMHVAMEEGHPVVTENGTISNDPLSYKMNEDYGQIQDNKYSSEDERSGGTVDVEYTLGNIVLETGFAGDMREKSYSRDFNRYSEVDVGDIDVLTLADTMFYGGELTDFLPEYGSYAFGSVFDAAGAKAFINEPGEVIFSKVPDDLTYSFTDARLKNYEATEDLYAGYLMGTLRWKDWEFIVGFRYERAENSITNNRIVTRRDELADEYKNQLPSQLTFIQPAFWSNLIGNFGEEVILTRVKSERTFNDVLPAFHAIRRIGDQMVVRASMTQTLARPRYDELAPREIVGISGAQFRDNVELANFEIQPMESINYDLSGDYYFNSFGMIGVSAFYKDLEGPHYDEIRALSPSEPLYQLLTERYYADPSKSSPNWTTTRRANAGEAYLYGLEVSYEKRFSELPEPWDGLGVSANATLIKSDVELLLEERKGEHVPLFLQSDRLANFSLSYEKYGFLVKLSWLYRGKYLNDTIAGGEDITTIQNQLNLPVNEFADPWTAAEQRIDALIEYRPTTWMTIYFEGVNLTNTPREVYYGTGESRLSYIRYTEPVYFIGSKISF